MFLKKLWFVIMKFDILWFVIQRSFAAGTVFCIREIPESLSCVRSSGIKSMVVSGIDTSDRNETHRKGSFS